MLWSHDLVDAIVAQSSIPAIANEILDSIRTIQTKKMPLILRSSVIGETIWDRGTYLSKVIGRHDGSIELQEVVNAAAEIVNSAAGHRTALILQSFVDPTASGEFGNLPRVSKTRDHWELSTRTSDAIHQYDRFNSQRDRAPSMHDALLAQRGISRPRFFGSVGAWINNDLLRGHAHRVNCEWIQSGNQFWLVQIDGEDEDISGVNPHQIHVRAWSSPITSSTTLVRVPTPDDSAEWDKLQVIEQLFFANEENVPRLFLLPCKDILARINDSSLHSILTKELETVFQEDIVVRTSGKTGVEKSLNLPRTDCVSPSDAAAWCIKHISEPDASLGNIENYAFILHRFIDAHACAWVRADTQNPIVEVHGTWGLPEALQYCSYDTWEVHVDTQEITEYPDYKSYILLNGIGGKWSYERVKNEVARHQSISRSNVLDLATRSQKIAERLGRPVHIMWFVCRREAEGRGVNIPWYWTEVHRTAENPGRGNLRLLTVKGYSDLTNVGELKAKHPNLALLLAPKSIELFRSNKFLEAVSQVATDHEIPVYLNGSSLANSYYQLQKNGCLVIPSGEKAHTRTRESIEFGKLVRDGIPDKIAAKRELASTITAPESTRTAFLIGKSLEELIEVRESIDTNERRAELADALEVLRGLISAAAMNFDEVVQAADRKKSKLGGFDSGTILLRTSLPTADQQENSFEQGDFASDIMKKLDDSTCRLPFAFFGFAPLSVPKSLEFPSLGVRLVVTLQRDCLDLTIQQLPKQLELKL